MGKFYELKLEDYAICLYVEIISIDKNAFLWKQIDNDQHQFETNQLTIRELETLDQSENLENLAINSSIEVYTKTKFNENVGEIQGWLPGKLKAQKGKFCTVEIQKDGSLKTMIVNRNMVRKAVDPHEYLSFNHHNLKIYPMEFLDFIDIKKREKGSNRIGAFNENTYDKQRLIDVFVKDIKQILNPYFIFINTFNGKNSLVINDDIDQELINLLLKSTFDHYIEIIEREQGFINASNSNSKQNISKEQFNPNQAIVASRYLYEKHFYINNFILEIIQPKIQYYKDNFCVFFEIKPIDNRFFIKIYSNSFRILFDCFNDINIVEKYIELNVNRKNTFFDNNSQSENSFKSFAESQNILFYEIYSENESKTKVKILGNEKRIEILKTISENHLLMLNRISKE